MGRIVVGVDGSESSRQALLWAAREAALRDAHLEVIHTYEHKPSWTAYRAEGTMSPADVARLRAEMEAATVQMAAHAQGVLDKMLADLASEPIGGYTVEGRAIESSHPAETLTQRSRDADMLVVGSRGRGSFRSLMLGSVSQQCAHHADCPVVIIRSARPREA